MSEQNFDALGMILQFTKIKYGNHKIFYKCKRDLYFVEYHMYEGQKE